MRNWLIALATLIALAGPAQSMDKAPDGTTQRASDSQRSERSSRLDSLIAQQNFDQLLYVLFPQTTQGKLPPLSAEEEAQDIAWLSAQAVNGHVPLMYFLSWKLMSNDINESRKWNARARIGVMLVQKECVSDPRSPWYLILEGRGIANNMTVRDSDLLWYRAVDEALSWHANGREHLSTSWYCGSTNVLPLPAATDARAAYWQKIKTHNDAQLAKLH